MFASKDIIVVETMIQELEAEGQLQRARVLTALLGEVLRDSSSAQATRTPSSVAKTPRPFMTTGEVARAIGVSPQTVKNWAAAGHLSITQLGGREVLRREDVLQYLDTLRKVPQREPPWAADDVSQSELRGRLPEELVERIDWFHERIERGERISREELTELHALEASTVELTWKSGNPDDR